MRWRKKPREIDLSGAEAFAPRTIDLSNLSEAGPARLLPVQRPAAPLTKQEVWERLGPRVWEMLRTRRMKDLWPEAVESEFQRYVDLAAERPLGHEHEIFLGLRSTDTQTLDAPRIEPFFVPRAVFKEHAYILGASGSGKSAHAIPQLLCQLAQPYAWTRPGRVERAPILIIDLKPEGDSFLRSYAERLAREQNRPLRFFSNTPNYVSLQFDPMQSLRPIIYLMERAETLLKALSLIYPEGYGSDFFTNEQRALMIEVLYEKRPRSFAELVRFVREATTGKTGNQDARGLYTALKALSVAMHVHTGDTPLPRDQVVDFERFYEEDEILYVHLDSRGLYPLSRDIGKLMLFSLMGTAKQRKYRNQLRQTFVFIDEFHRLAARNVVELLQDSRSAGVAFILAHQTSDSLRTRDGDLYGTLFQNCRFKQCLTLEDPHVIDLFKLISGRRTEIRRGGANTKGTSKGTGNTHASTRGSSDMSGESWESLGSQRYSTSHTSQHGSQMSFSEKYEQLQSETSSWQEEMVAGLTPEMIVEVNDTELLSLVHVKGVGDRSLTPTGGIPVLVQGLYPVTAGEFYALTDAPWPQKPVDLDECLARNRPSVSRAALEAVQKDHGRTLARPPAPRRNAQTAQYEAKLQPLAQKLAPEMLPEFVPVEVVARQLGLPVARLLELAHTLKSDARRKEDRLAPWLVETIRKLVESSGAAAPPEPAG